MAAHEPVTCPELPASSEASTSAFVSLPATIGTSDCPHTAAGPESADSGLDNPTRADWRLMLGLTRRDRVLVLGGDSGELGARLAPWVQQVYSAAGSTRELPEPTEHVALGPIAIKHALSRLPLTEAALDCVIVNGPMPGGHVAEVLAMLLPQLKPGGHLCVTFNNRWGLRGRFGTPQPAEAAGVACRGLRHALCLMAAAGCSDLAGYALLPNPRSARTIIPLQPPCPPAAEKFAVDQAWKRASAGRALGRLVLHLCIDLQLMRHLYPDFLVVGRKAC